MDKEIVSVIIPCYNQAQFLPEALQSVLEQTYENWECIIVNDGSPDNTHEVAQEWLAKDTRFTYIQKENGGLSSARNAGLEIANGKYIQFLDSDDILSSTKFKVSINCVHAYKADVVVSNFRMFSSDGLETTEPFCVLNSEYLNYESILYGWDDLFSIPIHCGFFKKTFFEKFRFPLNLKAKEDWIMWVLFFKENPASVFRDESLAFYRIHPESMTKDTCKMQENLLYSFIYLKNNLSSSDFDRLLVLRVGSLIKSIDLLKKEITSQKIKLSNLKNSNTYKIAFKIRRFLKDLGVLKLFKVVLNKVTK